MKDIVIYGAGGFGREVVWAMNSNSIRPVYNILGYCDDDPEKKRQNNLRV